MRAVRITVICLVLNFLCLSAAWAGEILQENVPLERNGIQLHLERYAEQDGQEKKPILFVHGVTYSSHEFDVDYGDYSLTRYLARHGFEVWLLDIAGFGRFVITVRGYCVCLGSGQGCDLYRRRRQQFLDNSGCCEYNWARGGRIICLICRKGTLP